MSSVTNIYIDNLRKYKFRIGDIVKLKTKTYEILNIQPLEHKEACGAVPANTTASTYVTKDFDTYMKPTDRYLFYVEKQGIDGNCEFRFEYPRGQPHFAPRGNVEFIDGMRAGKLNPKYIPHIIYHPYFPSVKLHNPTGSINNSDMYFYGEKWHVRKFESEMDIPQGRRIIEITDYHESGELGVA